MFSVEKWFGKAALGGILAGACFSQVMNAGAQEPRSVGPDRLPGVTQPAVLGAPSAPVTKTTAVLPPTPDAEKTPAPPEAVPPKGTPPEANPSEVAPTEPTGADAKKGAPDLVQPAAPKSAWLTHPPVHRFPMPGNAWIPPTGPGYYSGLDWLRGDLRQSPPKNGYLPFVLMPPSFFDADFRYVDAPDYQPTLQEQLHRIHLGDNWMVGTGGSAWWRHMREFNSRLTGQSNSYDLLRARIYGDVWYQDRFRIFAEFITAHTFGEDLAPLRIDQNRADLLNLFVDIKIGEIDCKPVYVRAGRQELLLGSQRLISTLDWGNTRRTFEGVRAFWLSEKLDVDLFWVKPVLVDNTRFDFADHNQNFAGAFVTYRPEKKEAIDLYYLYLDNHNNTVARGLTTAPTSVHTLGSRYSGNRDGFLWDAEGMLQLGERGSSQTRAGAVTAGLGKNWSCLPMNPTIWAYYDWASGDPSPNSGNYNTFNQLFPFGHYYFGFADYVGRQNVRDWNFHLYLNPTKWITFNAQYHFLSLDRARDALYGPGGAPLRVSTTGSAGGVIGQELDLIVNFHLTRNTDVLLGYSRLNAGNFINNTGPHQSPELIYMMYNIRW